MDVVEAVLDVEAAREVVEVEPVTAASVVACDVAWRVLVEAA